MIQICCFSAFFIDIQATDQGGMIMHVAIFFVVVIVLKLDACCNVMLLFFYLACLQCGDTTMIIFIKKYWGTFVIWLICRQFLHTVMSKLLKPKY